MSPKVLRKLNCPRFGSSYYFFGEILLYVLVDVVIIFDASCL